MPLLKWRKDLMTERRIETAKRTAVSYRNYRRARERALTRLAQAHPEIYKEMLEQEKASDETQGKKWLDIDGTTTTGDLGARSPATATHRRETDNRSENQGNNGGEA
jgi:hypothetical protein